MSAKRESARIAALAAGAAIAVVGNANASDAPRLAKDQYVCRPVTKENLKKPPPFEPEAPEGKNPVQTRMIRQFADDAKLADLPCASEQVAYPRSGQREMQSPGPGLPIESEADPSASMAPPRDGTYDAAEGDGYAYVGATFSTIGVGGFVDINVARPPELTSGSHSIGQMSFLGPPGLGYTVELGWQSHLYYYGGNPRLFTFVNKDYYASYGDPGGDCYNCHFVPLAGADYVIGQELPYTGPLLNFVTLKFGMQNWEGDWWVWVGDQWIGYLEGDFWPESFTWARYRSYYGEIFDPEYETDMGNGRIGLDEAASVMENPQVVTYKDPAYQVQDEELSYWTEGNWTGRWGYDGGNVSVDRRRWKFGGPGLS